MTFLLDVNVLIALLDTDHDFHNAAHAWFDEHAALGWATCAITENAAMRILGKRTYPNTPGPPGVVAEMLEEFFLVGQHVYWDGDLRFLKSPLVDRGRVTRADQITDIHLLAIAVKHNGALATFDRQIMPHAVLGGAEALHTIPRTN